MWNFKKIKAACIFFCGVLPLFLRSPELQAQTDYEIQVYSSGVAPVHALQTELHSNFAFYPDNRGKEFPINHRDNETVELTKGITSFSELGFYFFSYLGNGSAIQYGGSHIRPKITLPDTLFPVGLSLSAEIGFVRDNQKDPYVWNTEIRPVIDKKFKSVYLSFNPVLEGQLSGPAAEKKLIFSPNFKLNCDVSAWLVPGVEYYGLLGPFSDFLYKQQQHLVFLTADLSKGTRWEFNTGIGWNLSQEKNFLVYKLILGMQLGK